MNSSHYAGTSGAGYYTEPGDAADTVWFIFVPSGDHIGSCATRDDALRLVRLAGHGAAKPPAGVAPGPALHAAGVGSQVKSW